MKRGVCTLCDKYRVVKSDIIVDMMLLSNGTWHRSGVGAKDGVRVNLRMKHPLCITCTRRLVQHGEPVVNTASGGVVKRLTRKQELEQVRRLARLERDLHKDNDS